MAVFWVVFMFWVGFWGLLVVVVVVDDIVKRAVECINGVFWFLYESGVMTNYLSIAVRSFLMFR